MPRALAPSRVCAPRRQVLSGHRPWVVDPDGSSRCNPAFPALNPDVPVPRPVHLMLLRYGKRACVVPAGFFLHGPQLCPLRSAAQSLCQERCCVRPRTGSQEPPLEKRVSSPS